MLVPIRQWTKIREREEAGEKAEKMDVAKLVPSYDGADSRTDALSGSEGSKMS
jgi:hypothetical protein